MKEMLKSRIALLVTIIGASELTASTVIWNGPAATNTAYYWSAGANWSGGAPANNDVKFFDAGAIPGASNINNTVDANVSIGTLQYGNTNGNHTTLINNGVTLLVTNGAGGNVLFVGTSGTTLPNTQLVNATVTGPGGSLTISNQSGFLTVNQGCTTPSGTQRSTLDLGGLDNFNATVTNVFVGSLGATTIPAANGAAVTGTLQLARTNHVTVLCIQPVPIANSCGIDVAYNGSGTQGGVDYLYLGQLNYFNVDSVRVGSDKGVGAMTFGPGFAASSPTAVFRGITGGSSRVSYWSVGDQGPRGSSSPVVLGTNDFTGGTLDALVKTMIVGQDDNGSGSGYSGGSSALTGVFAFNAGTLDVNTLTLGNIQNSVNYTNKNPIVGIMRINGGTLKVNAVLQMGATVPGNTGGAYAGTYAQLGITNGAAWVNNVTVGTNISSVNNRISLSNATFIVSNTVATSLYPLTNFYAANSTVGLTLTSDGAAKMFVGNLITGGATNVIQIDANPVFFASYPQQFPLIEYYGTNNANNFGLTNIPAWAPGASLISNGPNSSIDLYLPSDPRPVITKQPAPYSGNPGSSVTTNLAVTVAAGSVTPLYYRWYFVTNGVTNALTDGNGPSGVSTVSGSTTTNLQIINAQGNDSGNYFVVVTNLYGAVTSALSTVTISSASVPVIYGLSDQTVIQGSNATFSATVAANPAAQIQWQTGGTNIPGATGTTLVVTNVQYSQNGSVYSIIASNSVGRTTNSATLTVVVPAVITQQPTNITVMVGAAAAFNVAATGIPAPTYQWYRNGSPISGANNSSYTVSNPQGPDNGAMFTVSVSNSVNTVISSNAVLTVLSTMTGAFGPTNGAVNISSDQQLRIIFSSAPLLNTSGTFTVRDAANNAVVQTIDAAQFLSYTPGNTSIQTIPNAAVRTVQGSYSGTAAGSTSYYYMPIALYGNEAWITLTNRLSYGHTYYATCDTGLFLDATGAAFPGISGTNTWSFSTKASGPATPTVSTGPTAITVGQDGAGDFATFQGAFDWIPQSNTLARTVHVLPGIYRDSATLAGSRNFVTIVGDGASRTNAQLIYPFVYFAPPNPVFTAGSLRIESSDVAVENLTLDNIIYGVYHPTGYASSGAPTNFAGAINTLATTGKRIVFDNVLIKGGQDTIYDINGVIYYHNCEVWGSVDFIYGAALAVFDQCNIVEIRNTGGPVTAPNTAYAQPYGITFLNCTFPQAYVTNGYPYDVGAATTTFMRPWGKDGMTASINCALGNQFSTMGYGTFGNTNEDECRAREYGTTLIGGGVAPTITQRQAAGAYWVNTIDPDYTNNPSLQPTDPSLAPPTGNLNRVAVTVNPNDYTLSAIFGNSYFNLNGWLPAVLPTITTQPTNQTVSVGATVTLVAAALGLPSPSFQWLKNGTSISGATNSTLTITNVQPGGAGSYSLIASNTAGSATSSNANLSVTFPTNSIGGVSVPAINLNNVVNVLNYGAVGDGVRTNTTAIQNAINQAGRGGKTNNLYGGTVEIPPGIFLSGPLTLTNNVNLQIDAGAILRMLPFTNYPMTWYTNMLLLVPTDYYFVVSDDFISGNNLTNIEISGSGAIDGQGSPWWPWAYTNGAVRPSMISLSGCNRELIQNVTLSNSPSVFIGIGSGSGNTIVQYVTVRAPSSYDATNPSHNTDACDVRGTNILVQFNDISSGDDDFSCLGGTSGVTVSNNVYGDGHGTSMGSQLAGGASNFVFINCTYTNTDSCAHIKTDRDRGGLIQNINYYNLTFTNVMHPIQIYCEYTNNTIPALDSITPAAAAALTPAPITSTTPRYRDITISNFSGNAQSTRAAGLIWGLPECSISNVTLVNVQLTGSKTFGIYDAKNVRIIDSSHSVPAGVSQYSFFDAEVTFSNSAPSASTVTLDGLATNGFGNAFTFYNCAMTLRNTNALGLNSSVTLGSSTFVISNSFSMTPSNSFNFILGTNAATVVVKGNLALRGTNNIYAGDGFAAGTYTLMTYTGTLSGSLPTLGATPPGYVCTLDTNTPGQVNVVVSAPPGTPANLTATAANLRIDLAWPSPANALGYTLLRSRTNGGPYAAISNVAVTNYSDSVNPGVTYYYVVVATNTAGSSGYSPQAAAAALPSSVSTNLSVQVAGNQMQLSWPADHTGWRLESQTNSPGTGLGTNWQTVAGSTLTNQVVITVGATNGSVFFRLAYP